MAVKPKSDKIASVFNDDSEVFIVYYFASCSSFSNLK